MIDEPVFAGEVLIPPEIARRRALQVRMPLAPLVEIAPPRILVAGGKPVSPDAEEAMRQALEARRMLDAREDPERAPVIPKRGGRRG